jgi:pimeloyl-ACP methyl ester carboxylesterase
MAKNTRAAAVRPVVDSSVRRAYFDCRFGQLHVHCALPAGGGFDEATTLICLPGSQTSGRYFSALLPLLGRDRSVYAPDLPGGPGESDRPPPGATAAQIAAALTDFLDGMRFRRIDVLAVEEAVALAAALVSLRPQLIGRIVLAPPGDANRTLAASLGIPAALMQLGAAGQPLSAEAARQALPELLANLSGI